MCCPNLSRAWSLVCRILSTSVSGMRSIPRGYPERWLEKVHRWQVTPISYLISPIEHSSTGSLLYKSRIRTEPTTVTAPQFTAQIWGSLESLVDEMTVCCIKVQHTNGPVAVYRALNQSTGVHSGKGSKTKEGCRNRYYVSRRGDEGESVAVLGFLKVAVTKGKSS